MPQLAAADGFAGFLPGSKGGRQWEKERRWLSGVYREHLAVGLRTETRSSRTDK
jgi:hypothetical protein